jgi:membrane-associated protease RseP (regulator of RpoE activity)
MGGVIVNFVTAWIYIWAVSGKVWSVFELLNTFIAGIPTAIVSTFSNPGSPNNFTGPIGLIDIFSDPKNLIVLFPIVSLGLAVTNLIPLPALDGGQFLFGSIEHIRQKAFSRRAQIALIGLSVVALIALTIASTVSDIVRLVG